MIITRTPVRIEIGGGGTDLPSFYTQFGSYFISAAINKYVYVTVHNRKYHGNFVTKYFKISESKTVSGIEDNLTKACLKYLQIDQPLEINSNFDLPGHSGLGSSGAFCVGLLNALHVFKNAFIIKSEGNITEAKVEINADEETLLNLSGDEVFSKYSIDYLKKIIKGSKLSDSVVVQFGQDYPLRIDYNVIDKMSLSFILAPRVSGD